jgi:hypothetical protein
VQWSATCRASRLQVVTHTFLSPSYMFFLTNDRAQPFVMSPTTGDVGAWLKPPCFDATCLPVL